MWAPNDGKHFWCVGVAAGCPLMECWWKKTFIVLHLWKLQLIRLTQKDTQQCLLLLHSLHNECLVNYSYYSYWYLFAVWGFIWQECHPPLWSSSQTVEFWTPRRTMSLSHAINGYHTSVRRDRMKLTKQKQVGCMFCFVFFFTSDLHLKWTVSFSTKRPGISNV